MDVRVSRCAPLGALGARRSAVALACVGLALILGVVRSSAAPPTPSFALASTYATGIGAVSVAMADLNGDGKRDLAAADLYDDALLVLLNRGNGSFSARGDYRAGDGPFAVALADLNGDGRLDVAIADVEAGVSVLLNAGDGRLRARREYRTDVGPVSVVVGDLNGDRKPDLATANGAPNTVSVLFNAGDGSFEPRRDYGTGSGPAGLAIGDLDGDGKLDLATANAGKEEKLEASVSVLLNRGDGSFSVKRDYGTGRAPASVAFGDLNGDANLDMATANEGDNTVSVLLNRGDGSFGARRTYRTDRRPVSVAIGDLNGDRKRDLATANTFGHASGGYLGHTLSVLTNRGDGRFHARRDYLTGRGRTAGRGPTSVAIGYLNGDGKPDLASANGEGGVSILLNATGLCAVPNLRAQTVPDARRAIRRGNCRLGRILHGYSRRVEKAHVIAQKPQPGMVLPKGGKVDFVVSRGPKR